MNRLVDGFNRRHTYLKISLTDRCDQLCRYCMPPDWIQSTPKEEFLGYNQDLEWFLGLRLRTLY